MGLTHCELLRGAGGGKQPRTTWKPGLHSARPRACRATVPPGGGSRWGKGGATDQQVQAVQVGLDVVGILGGHAPELLQLRAPRLPDDHGEGHHPLDALLDVAPLVPCGGHAAVSAEAAAGPVAPAHPPARLPRGEAHLRPCASARRRRSGRGRTRPGRRRGTLSSPRPARRGPGAAGTEREGRPQASAGHAGRGGEGGRAAPGAAAPTSAIWMKTCWGY